jgi:hypothetical protein
MTHIRLKCRCSYGERRCQSCAKLINGKVFLGIMIPGFVATDKSGRPPKRYVVRLVILLLQRNAALADIGPPHQRRLVWIDERSAALEANVYSWELTVVVLLAFVPLVRRICIRRRVARSSLAARRVTIDVWATLIELTRAWATMAVHAVGARRCRPRLDRADLAPPYLPAE